MKQVEPVQSVDDFEQQVAKLRDILCNPLYTRLSPEDIKTNDPTSSKKGGQGSVVIGTLTRPPESKKPELRVAVKKLDWERNNPTATVKAFKSFVNEVKLRAWLLHPNIALLLGFVEDIEKGYAWLISPWEANGNVREFLQSGEWEIPERVALIQDVARGVEFLHIQEPPICHGDLKSFNILVNSEYTAVITDFGSARTRPPSGTCKEQDLSSIPQAEVIERTVAKLLSSLKAKFDENTKTITLTGPAWSLRWTAPEVLDDGVQTLPSDMWALGWISWEIVTGKIPFEELNNDRKVIIHTIEGRLPPIRENSQLALVLKLCSMMSDCWLVDPNKRIDATSFRKKVEMMPSATPVARSSEGPKAQSAMLLLSLGQMYLLQDDKINAELHYREALEVATRTKDEAAKGHALNYLGDVYRAQANDEEAKRTFLEAHAIHSRIGDDLGAANALLGLGETYRSQSRNSEAEKAFLEGHAIYSRIGYDLGAANALCGLGDTYHRQSRNSEAEKAFLEAHAIHSRIGNDLGAANTLCGLGETYDRQSRNSEAEKAFLEAHAICSRIGNDLGAANALHGLGETYRSQSRNSEAEKAFLEAHAIHSRIDDDLGAANALYSLGETYHRQSRNSEAEKVFLEAHAIHSRIDNDLGAASALYGLGKMYLSQSRNREAEKAFLAAHAIYSRIGYDLGAANALYGLGEMYLSQSRNREADETLLRAHKLYTFIGDQRGIGHTLRALSFSLYQTGREGEAAAHCLGALHAYQRIEDRCKQAETLLILGSLYGIQGQQAEAKNAANEALAILMNIGDDEGQTVSSSLVTVMHFLQSTSSTNESSMESLLQVTESLADLGITVSDPKIARALGDRYSKQGRISEAEEHYRLAQAIYMSGGDSNGEATALLSLGKLYGRQAQYELAEEHIAQARVAYAIAADKNGEADALDGLIAASVRQRKFDAARSYCMDACEIYARSSRPVSEICAKVWQSLHDL